MYSIKGTKDIEFNYNISSIRKISDTEYQYHGKPNSPNLVLSNGIKRISYVAERIEMKPRELIIHHSATSNFPNKAMVIFPLVVSEGRVTTIDRLLGMEMNETLDLDIGSEITDFTMEINETQKSAYVVRLSGGLPISKKPTIIEGASCGLSALEQTEMERLKDHVNQKNGQNPHKTSVSQGEFQTLLDGWLDTSKCYKDGAHYMKEAGATVSMNNNGDIVGAIETSNEVTGELELTSAECSTIGGSKGIGDGGGDGGLSPNQEMECFPNEGGVFNLKFHIIYDISGTEEFIAETGVDLVDRDKESNNDKKNNKTLRDAMNAEVKNLKEHIEKLGGIYVPKVDHYDGFHEDTGYKYIQSAGNAIIDPPSSFFTKNPVDIFITYIASKATSNEDGEAAQIRKFSDISDTTINGIGDLKKPHEAKECILVGVKQGTDDPLLMNAKKFSEDYLNKDFNRYTHISIPGYMSATENQSMKAIMALLGTIFASSIAYYTIPGFYKIAIKKITRNNRDCGEGYENYYKATAFNYLFTIITIVIPLIIMITSGGVNAVLSGILALGIIFILAIKARYALDNIFFYSFYPLKCNKTTKFREEEEYGSRFKVFTYIPASMSALFSG